MNTYSQLELKRAAIKLGFKQLFELPINVSYTDLCAMLDGSYVLPELKPRIHHRYVSLRDLEFDGTVDGLIEQFSATLKNEQMEDGQPDTVEIDEEEETVNLGWYGKTPHTYDVVKHEGLRTISNLVTAYADKILAEYHTAVKCKSVITNSVGKSNS